MFHGITSGGYPWYLDAVADGVAIGRWVSSGSKMLRFWIMYGLKVFNCLEDHFIEKSSSICRSLKNCGEQEPPVIK